MNGGEVGCGEAIVSGYDASEVFQPTEHPLDGVAVASEDGVERAIPPLACPGRNVRHRAARFEKARSAITLAPSGTGAIRTSPPQRFAPPGGWKAIELPSRFAAA